MDQCVCLIRVTTSGSLRRLKIELKLFSSFKCLNS